MKRSKVTIETTQLLAIRSRGGVVQAWCAACDAPSLMVRAEQAAFIAGVSLRAICRRADAGDLHFTETAEGQLFICFSSLLPLIQI